VDALKHVAYLELMTDKNFLDCDGAAVPSSRLKARKPAITGFWGDLLTVHADDPAAIIDIHNFCASRSQPWKLALMDQTPQAYVIRKK